MGYVHGHWRETGWVRGHFRHPLRPGLDQVVLVFLSVSPVQIDLRRDADAPSCPLPDRPLPDRPLPDHSGIAVPAPRPPSDRGGVAGCRR